MRTFLRLRAIPTIAVLAAACGCGEVDGGGASGTRPAEPARGEERTMAEIELTSEAFVAGGPIPVRYTCEGEDLSPPLAWSGAPEGTRSFALAVEDPDAPRGTFVHWVLYDVPGHAAALPEGLGDVLRIENLGGALQGKNGFGRIGWGGPCPPPGRPHRYVFRLRALDAVMGLDPGVEREDLEAAIEGHVLAAGELTGTFGR